MLCITSFLFGWSAIHATMINEVLTGIGFMLLQGLSCLNHSYMPSGGDWIQFCDKIVARSLWVRILYHNYVYLPMGIESASVYVCLCYVMIVYFGWCKSAPSHKPFAINKDTLRHASIHVAACVGNYIHFQALAKAKAIEY